MRIAQIAPLFESVPPKCYGGTERIVAYLSDELVRQGHEVVLFASADSTTAAELVACCPRALRLAGVDDALPHQVLELERVRQFAGDFDVMHFHTDYLHFPLTRAFERPSVTTMHGRLDLSDYQALLSEFDDHPLVSISDNQRRALPSARWIATIHHGLPVDRFLFDDRGPGGYLAFLGRICPEKRPDRAIEIAKRAGVPLKIGAKVDPVNEAWFEEVIRPHLDSPWVEFIGEIDEKQKQDFLGGARALLFPIDWPEPFGLVMIESMACGTPVIAWSHGSVPEVIDDGVTGFLVKSIDEAVATVGRVDKLDRRRIRARFEARFTAERMAREYVAAYRSMLASHDRATISARRFRSAGRVPAEGAAD